MKIIHVLNTASYSGAENVVISIINEMNKNQENEIIYVSKNGNIKEYLKEYNINFEPIKKLSIKEMRRVIKKYNPDIIHAHDFTASVICALTCKKIKLISHIHNNSLWIRKINIKSVLYLLASKKFRKILLVSDSIVKEYIFKKHIVKKTVVIGNPIKLDSIREKALINNETSNYDVIFLGRFSNAKDPKKFIDIVDEISKENKIKAIMIGDGPLKNECNNLIEKKMLNNVITIKSFMKNPYPMLNASKILCMTSRWEGFGLVAVEALTLGKPVVATYTGGIPDIVDESCGKVTNNINDFKNEIIKLLNDKVYYEKKSNNAFIKSGKFDNIDSYIKNLIKIYNQ